MTLNGKLSSSLGAQAPNLSAYLAAPNGVGDYFAFDYTTFGPPEFTGVAYGSFFLRDASTSNTTTKNILTFSGATYTLTISQNHAGSNAYTIEIDLNGSTFVSVSFPPSTEWRWFYFYCDFENGTGFLRFNGTDSPWAAAPAGQAITPEDITNVTFIENSTYDAGQRFGRLYCDFDSTVTVDEFLELRKRFARVDPSLIVPRKLGELGQLGTGNVPALYMLLTEFVFLDSRQQNFTPVGTDNILFDNAIPIVIVL